MANDTRLLMLGAVKLFEPVNGYQIRRELVSWSVEEWANIRPGSIYSALATLTKQGMLARHEVPEGGRSVAVYTLTAAGQAEFDRLYAAAVTAPDRSSSTAMQAAVALIPLVPRPRFAELLAERVRALAERRAADAARSGATAGAVPGHVAQLAAWWAESTAVEEAWCRQLLDRVRAGELTFAGEPWDWTPAPDDPGWQIHRDHEHYRRVLNLG
ncbi:PadR family transcriptional regulator [Pilimelia anulata]|uniref:PadR family transcriptional regulator n=1 Tax=Pilimelia anulata TaxID=53371 RepID=A0A8J3F8I4_9ACTN|nr:helix-turn-helix transcriptional regulator [Pilimelia anulata]GGJ89417.1 PadR family transcriptional regulator [Pilimelia anulata]